MVPIPVILDNAIVIDAPLEHVWEMTNDVESWPHLFTEYESTEILERHSDSIVFRLTTVPDADGTTWSWVSQRWADPHHHTVRAQRIETGPFEFMRIRWDYEQLDIGVKMRWRQEFSVKPDSGWSDEAARQRLQSTTEEQMEHIKIVVEKKAPGQNGVRQNVVKQNGAGQNGARAAVVAGPGDAALHRERLLLLTCGIRLVHIVSTLAGLGISEALRGGPRKVSDLADEVGADTDALYRVLRCAASVGIFTETEPEVFARTPLSDPIAADAPYSLRALIDYSTKPFVNAPYAALADSVRDGQPSTLKTLGTDFWGHLAANPEDDAFFDQMMTDLGRWETDRHLDVIEPERRRWIVDLGGGKGHFLSAALQRSPEAIGTLVEREDVAERAWEVLADAGVEDRVTTRAADLFSSELPTGADVYLLKAVLHNWSDDRAIELLKRVRQAIGDGAGSLFVIEHVVAPGNAFDHAKFLDVDMLVLFGGRERTLEQWRTLFSQGGFTLANRPDEGRWTVLHAEPV